MNKQPIDPYRMVGLIAGIVFFGIGIYLVLHGVAAEGTIDIQSTILSGKITAGSAGLFVLFFSFFIIMLSILLGHHIRVPLNTDQHDQDNIRRLFSKVFYSLVVATVFLVIVAVVSPADKKTVVGFAAGGFGFLTLFALIALVSIEDDQNKKK